MRQGIIAAVSTPPGKGGVAIIRICGDGALLLVNSLFHPRSGKELRDYSPQRQAYGYIKDGDEVVDDGLACYFTRGASYTGEETVELSIHGGVLVTRRVLELLFMHGAIPAAPGEFTRLAFINGRLSLTEVEAIGDLLEAKSEEQLRLASATSRQVLKDRIEGLRGSLVELLGSLYARIDYPEEDLGELTDGEITDSLTKIKESLSALISTYRTGRAIKEGISTVLVGRPNVGKSTLYNLIVGEDAAIVTDIPGTTRDLLERETPLGKVLLRLVDTAGVHSKEGLDRVEEIGIARTKERIREAELILALFDSSEQPRESDLEVIEALKESSAVKVAIFTKCDAPNSHISDFESILEGFEYRLKVSAKESPDAAIAELKELVEHLFTSEKINTASDAIISSARQHASLTAALGLIDSALEAFRLGVPADAAASDVELALARISEVDGRAVSDEVVSDIFSRFCVGK